MKKLISLVAVLTGLGVSAVCLPGCSSGPGPYLPIISKYVADANQVLGKVQTFVDTYFAAHPDADKQAKVNAAIKKASAALSLAEKALNGAADINDGKIAEAFADFVSAYNDLMVLVEPMGVVVQDPADKNLKAAGPGQLAVPPAQALVPKVGK